MNRLFIAPGSLWENGYSENFNGRLGIEVLKGEIFQPLAKAKFIIERWRQGVQPDQATQLAGLQVSSPRDYAPLEGPGRGTLKILRD